MSLGIESNVIAYGLLQLASRSRVTIYAFADVFKLALSFSLSSPESDRLPPPVVRVRALYMHILMLDVQSNRSLYVVDKITTSSNRKRLPLALFSTTNVLNLQAIGDFTVKK